MDRILVIKLGAFGDVVQAAGAIQDIRNHHPDDEIIVMTTPAYRRIMERCPWVDSVFIDPRDPRWRLDRMAVLRRRIRDLDVDMVYDLQQVGRTAWYFRWFFSDIPWLGHAHGCRYRSRGQEKKGAMDRFARQLADAGLDVRHTLRPDVSWMADDVTGMMAENQVRSPYIVLVPGASVGRDEKRWPWYDDLAAWLRTLDRDVVTVPGPDELELCGSFQHALMLTDGARYLDFFELAGVLLKADLVIGNDTGPTHLAAHLRRNGIALFSGHMEPHRTGIQHTRFTVLEVDDLASLELEKVQEEVLSCLDEK